MRNMYDKLINWPTEKFLYRATVLELVERGHRLQEAKKLMKDSGMNARINQDAEMLASIEKLTSTPCNYPDGNYFSKNRDRTYSSKQIYIHWRHFTVSPSCFL